MGARQIKGYMKTAHSEISLAELLPKRLLPLSLTTGILIGFLFPLIFFLFERNDLENRSLYYSERVAANIREAVMESPDLWKYQVYRFASLRQQLTTDKEVCSIVVYDENRLEMELYSYRSPECEAWWNRFAPHHTHPLIFNNTTVGSVYVGISQENLIIRVVIVSVISGSIALLIALFSYVMPVRIVRRLDNDMQELFDSLANSKVESDELRCTAEESEKRFREMVDGLDAIVWEADPETRRYIFVNHRVENLIKCVSEVWLSADDYYVRQVHPNDREKFIHAYQKAVEQRANGQIEYRRIRSDGSTVWLQDTFLVETRGQGSVRLSGVIIDITEQKHLEEQLLQSQKMEAIGHLAGGVAHDFNNILQVIMCYVQLLIRDPELENSQKKKVELILVAAKKGAQLTHGLLTFSRKKVMNPHNANLNNIVRHVQEFLVRVIGENIQLQSTCREAALNVKVDSGQIEQVLINLATNARDAMKKGGVLTLETGLQEIDPSHSAGMGDVEPGNYAVVTVSDTGCGMDEETMSRIFEPFFTTKEVGKGTGLGMAIVHGIIKQHNGFIHIYSEPGKGTTFRFYIPLVENMSVPDRERFVPDIPAGGDETILLAEDDAGVRTLVEETLKSSGYEVVLAENGQDAIDLFALHKDKIALVIMDIIMPEKSGADACKEIRLEQADVKVLYFSGYTMDIIQNEGELDDGTELIMKPVEPQELLSKVREMLDR